MIHVIQNVNYQPMVMIFKSILVVPNMLIVLNIYLPVFKQLIEELHRIKIAI